MNNRTPLTIDIHYPSCSSKAVASDSFAEALKREFADEYSLSFSFSRSPEDGTFHDGIRMVRFENGEDDARMQAVKERIAGVFLKLANSAR